MTTRPYRFRGFVLDVAARELRHGDTLVTLPARSFDCLAYLVEHRDRAVGRDELIAAVWGRAEVSDDLLGHTVLKARRVFGDTGSEQNTIRTVPRFGYRFVADVEVDEAPLPAVGERTIEPPARHDDVPVVTTVATTASPAAATRRPRVIAAAMALSALLLILAGGHWLESRDLGPAFIAPRAPAPAPVSALVLPAEIAADADWQWLRLGAMDLVAQRLQSSALHTLPSESVVTLIKARPAGADASLLHAADLAGLASLRVQPSLRRDGRGWRARLDVFGPQNDFQVEAEAADAITATRAAADRLLSRLGRTPDSSDQAGIPAELDDLLQRSGAAMLADQLVEGRRLLDAAPATLQQHPRIQHRIAQFDLRAGSYEAVDRRLLAVLPELSAEHDGALRARVLLTLASSYLRQGQSARAAPAYEEAIALRDGKGDGEAVGVARLGRGLIMAQDARFDEAIAELSRARIDLETVGDAMGIAAVDVNLGNFQMLQRHPAQALLMLQSAARQFERLGAREGAAHARMMQILAERDLIEPSAALATSEKMWPPAAHTSNRHIALALKRVRAEVLADLGRFAQATALVEDVHAETQGPGHALLRAQNHATAARVAWLQSDVETTRREAALALTPELRSDDALQYLRTSLLHARALRQLGRGDDADAAIAALDDGELRQRQPGATIYHDVGQAERQRGAAALATFETAMRAAEALNAPEEMILVAEPYLGALIAAGHLDTAREISGRIAPWADRDLRAARAQAALYRALGEEASASKAADTARRLSGLP